MKILFLHGWHSVPGGLKPSFLAQHGHELRNPALDDEDFGEAVRTAQVEYDRHRPDVIVGSSRGGAVAMNIDSGSTPLVLLCPAWKRWGTTTTVKPGTIILHSEADDVIPIADTWELVRNSGLPGSALIVVGTDHRLADPEPLQAMLDACERAVLLHHDRNITMSNVPNRETFESMYAGKAPWDIGKPQPAFVQVADRVTGAVLDAGCGTGENALFFAERGHGVLGIDFLEGPIQEASRKARERGQDAEFIARDALTLKTLDRQFDSVIDSGLFHVFSDEDRVRYVAGLSAVTKPGGRLFLLCFSDKEPGSQGPRRVSEQELREAFAHGWVVEELREARFEIVPGLKDIAFSAGGPKAWFSVIRREG